MKTSRKNTTFYIEIIALLLLLLFGISVLVQVFGSAQKMGREAKELSIAIPIAQNVIEIFTAKPNIEGIAEALGENAIINEDQIIVYYAKNGDITTKETAYFTMELSIYTTGKIQKGTVLIRQNEREIYGIETEIYIK